MEGLTKENFFNEQMRINPLVTQRFCDWVDEYKSEANWDFLFNAGYGDGTHEPTRAPKFHELPLELQEGIMGVFLRTFDLQQVIYKVGNAIGAPPKWKSNMTGTDTYGGYEYALKVGWKIAFQIINQILQENENKEAQESETVETEGE
jgi:hypothetical protein